MLGEFGQQHRRLPQHQLPEKSTRASEGAHLAQRAQREMSNTSTTADASIGRSESFQYSAEWQKRSLAIRHLVIWLIGETASNPLGSVHRPLTPRAIAIKPTLMPFEFDPVQV
ncbi:hypothetical protein FEAC_13460 [Ferrimicrobium acidiphilum DSM 19497]|uniref:Uncharacterized protein n=1 Tax=Ferrimicrobium acidiphilum DSM 19497 TaxID=1121877 RepID=A0A0D8FV82_9ACTN|nr:hypothetical protein FEAC_13460 [Ferrimicrobium acidiphilum DSM 19497]